MALLQSVAPPGAPPTTLSLSSRLRLAASGGPSSRIGTGPASRRMRATCSRIWLSKRVGSKKGAKPSLVPKARITRSAGSAWNCAAIVASSARPRNCSCDPGTPRLETTTPLGRSSHQPVMIASPPTSSSRALSVAAPGTMRRHCGPSPAKASSCVSVPRVRLRRGPSGLAATHRPNAVKLASAVSASAAPGVWLLTVYPVIPRGGQGSAAPLPNRPRTLHGPDVETLTPRRRTPACGRPAGIRPRPPLPSRACNASRKAPVMASPAVCESPICTICTGRSVGICAALSGTPARCSAPHSAARHGAAASASEASNAGIRAGAVRLAAAASALAAPRVAAAAVASALNRCPQQARRCPAPDWALAACWRRLTVR